jgi:hypothetical protein
MGYGIIPDMTTGKWMCLEPCTHRDCKALREDFIENANCKICGKPLEADDKFYYCNPEDFPGCKKTDKVHFICEIERIENQRKVK